MDRALPLAGSFLVGVCVFAWLAGPVLEARFGAEALLTAYAAVALGAGALTYVVFRRVDARLRGSGDRNEDRAHGTEATTGAAESADPSGAGSSHAPVGAGSAGRTTSTGKADAAEATDGSTDATEEGSASEGAVEGRSRSTVMDELEALSIEAEVERLKEGRDGPADEG